jgi:hypothetical protein
VKSEKNCTFAGNISESLCRKQHVIMSNKNERKVKLRSFRVSYKAPDKSTSGLLGMLSNRLHNSLVGVRKMPINQDDPNKEEDCLSDFDIKEKSWIYATMIHVTQAKNISGIPDDFMERNKMKIEELNSAESGTSSVCKDYYYFLLNDDFLITNLKFNVSIKGFQTYVNWLLQNERDDLFEFSPVITKQKEIKMSTINKMVVKDASIHGILTKEELGGQKRFSIAGDVLKKLMVGVDTFDQIMESGIISAKLFVKFNKPKGMQEDVYERTMSACMKPISDVGDVTFQTKSGAIIKGDELLKTKDVSIITTESGQLSEKNLQQEMEQFLKDLRDENNN